MQILPSGFHLITMAMFWLGKKVSNKWYRLIIFKEDRKIAYFSDWFDVNGIQVQIDTEQISAAELKSKKTYLAMNKTPEYWGLLHLA